MNKKFLVAVVMVLTMAGAAFAQEVNFDASKSELKWKGEKVTGEHWGYIKLKSGSLTLKGDKIVSGKFVINMTTITNEDLEAGEWHDKLIGHLKSDDFFSVSKFPEAVLNVTESTPFVNGESTVKGSLTIKGITHPVEFKATETSGGYDAHVVVDRTLYDIRYGSGKFFEGLGDKVIYDEFTLDVKLMK